MGWNTMVMILNDNLHSIRENPERFVEDIHRHLSVSPRRGQPVDGDDHPDVG